MRLAGTHAACDVLGLETGFDEEHLYRNLDWLEKEQATIETSSYLEGTQNEWAAFGYNRDGKRGKMQIVVGLLCDQAGRPLSIEVFAGNTQDPAMVASQVKKLAGHLGGGEVTFVGDRGMVKSKQVEALLSRGFHYITSITKPQIETLPAEGTFTMTLFDQALAEVQDDEVRYVLRRNPVRADELRASREGKLERVRTESRRQAEYLAKHTRASVLVALRKVQEKALHLKLSSWVQIEESGRLFTVTVLPEASKLDGAMC